MVSPNFPADYPDGSDCDYVLDAGEQTVIVLTFHVFKIEGKFEPFPSVGELKREHQAHGGFVF